MEQVVILCRLSGGGAVCGGHRQQECSHMETGCVRACVRAFICIHCILLQRLLQKPILKNRCSYSVFVNYSTKQCYNS